MRHVTFTVVVEDAGSNFSVFVPDLPGCVSTGQTAQEAVENIREAIQLHIEGLVEDGLPVPPQSAKVLEVEAEVPN